MKNLLKGFIFTIFLLSTLSFYGCGAGDSSERLKIYSYETKASIKKKIDEKDWAKLTLEEAHKSVDKYVDQHTSDPEWILSRLQMYWKNRYTTPIINGRVYSHGEGEAPVATVRFGGARDWATDYATPSVEDIKPYMDYNDDQMYLQNNKKEGKPWEWVDMDKTAHIAERINEKIMTMAQNSAFIYWLSGEEKYAKFAADILVKYTEGMYYREAPRSEINFDSERIMGLTSFEVIHERCVEPMTLCYDFLSSYLDKQNIDQTRIHKVFQDFADRIILKGVPDNNWNIFQARFVTYLALSLDEDSKYENGKGRNFYIDCILNQTSERQKALREVCNTYDQNTAIWSESPSYSMATTKDIIEVLLLVDGIDNSNILKEFPIVERAAIASFEYLFPNNHSTSFGDSGYSVPPSEMYESLLTIYRKYGESEKEKSVISIINMLVNDGLYDRDSEATLYRLFNYVSDIPSDIDASQKLYSSALYAPNINLTILRNGMDRKNGLMLANSGTGFNHDHDNGINLELYGEGFPLGLDFAAGTSYWVPDHTQFYSKAMAHNTVIVDGVSSNSSRMLKLGEESEVHKVLSHYPDFNQKDAAIDPITSYVENEFLEGSTNSKQRRLNAIIRTSPTAGYYVDIFRSAKIDGGDKKHEYFYHNLGQSFKLYDAATDKEIAMEESSDLTSAAGMSKGYDYFTDKKEVSIPSDFRGTFELNFEDKDNDIRMDVWMEGSKSRKLFSVMSPRSLKAMKTPYFKEIADLPVPTLVVREQGEAWSKPFVAIYEPYGRIEGRSIKSVEYLKSSDREFAGTKVTSIGDNVEYILSSANSSAKTLLSESTLEFQGSYGVVSMRGGEISYALLGAGKKLSYGDFSVESLAGEATLLIDLKNGIKITTNQPISISAPSAMGKTLTYSDPEGAQHSVEGKISTIKGREIVTFEIEANKIK